MLRHPSTIGIGEVTRWPEVWAGRRELLERLALAPAVGKRIEGHTAGANREKVAVLAAAGFTSDHEPIYTLLFMTAHFLPSVRLTADGVWDVKRRRILRPSRRRARR